MYIYFSNTYSTHFFSYKYTYLHAYLHTYMHNPRSWVSSRVSREQELDPCQVETRHVEEKRRAPPRCCASDCRPFHSSLFWVYSNGVPGVLQDMRFGHLGRAVPKCGHLSDRTCPWPYCTCFFIVVQSAILTRIAKEETPTVHLRGGDESQSPAEFSVREGRPSST